jgi:hypothetical protein
MQIIIGLLVLLFLLLTASSVAVVDLVIVTKTILDDYVTWISLLWITHIAAILFNKRRKRTLLQWT